MYSSAPFFLNSRSKFSLNTIEKMKSIVAKFFRASQLRALVLAFVEQSIFVINLLLVS